MNESIPEPAIDHEWRALASRAKLEIINDEESDRERNAEYSRDYDTRPFGCYPSPQRNREGLWVCKSYIGRKQRLLGYGTCHQMMRLYDAAVACFAQYRTKKLVGSQYNFSQSPSPDIDRDAAAIVEDMEKLLLSRGLLVTEAERAEQRVFRAECEPERKRQYSLRAQILAQVQSINASIDDCNTRLSAIEKQNAAIQTQLVELANRQIVTLPYQPYQPLPETQPGVGWPVPPPVTCATPATFPELYEAAAKIRADYLSSPVADAANKSPWVDLLTTDKPVVS